MIMFTIPGECKPKGRPKFRSTGKYVQAYTPEATQNYENFVRICFEQSGCKKYSNNEALEAVIEIHKSISSSTSKKRKEQMINGVIRPITKPDVDNCAKSILDALNKIAYNDDSRIVELIVRKIYDNDDYTKVRIKEINE